MTTTTPDAVPASPAPWLDENIGLLRRLWRGRIWYGAEWYITVFGALVLIFVATITLAAPLIAPYDPNAFVGAQFTPPGRGSQVLIARAGESPIQAGEDLAGRVIGVQRNRNSANVAKALNAKGERYQDQKALVQGLLDGEVDLILIDRADAKDMLASFPRLQVVEEGLGARYALGTDNLGRDILSRLIWGARTVLSVALS